MAHEKLHQLILHGKWEQLRSVFAAMSHTDFHRAESFIRTTVLPQLPNETLWETLLHLIRFRRQAFLSGVLSVAHLAREGTLDFRSPHAASLAAHLQQTHPASILKAVNMMLPLLQTEQQAEALFHTFHIDDYRQRIMVLLKVESPLSYYLLFDALRHQADNRKLAMDCCRYIIRRNNDMAYNMAALLQAYFGLHELRGQFSLHIESYELSLLDRDPQAFYHILHGKRPIL